MWPLGLAPHPQSLSVSTLLFQQILFPTLVLRLRHLKCPASPARACSTCKAHGRSHEKPPLRVTPQQGLQRSDCLRARFTLLPSITFFTNLPRATRKEFRPTLEVICSSLSPPPPQQNTKQPSIFPEGFIPKPQGSPQTALWTDIGQPGSSDCCRVAKLPETRTPRAAGTQSGPGPESGLKQQPCSMERTQNPSSHSTEGESVAAPRNLSTEGEGMAVPRNASTSALRAVCLPHGITEPTAAKHYPGLRRIRNPLTLSELAGKHTTKSSPVKL